MIHTEIEQRAGDLHKDAVTSQEELDVIIELRNVADKVERVLGDNNIEDGILESVIQLKELSWTLYPERWKIFSWAVEGLNV